jgi:zinc transporter 1/2/3
MSSAEGISQLIAVAVLEFGVMLHSVIIGLTLAVNENFITLFIVIIFHRE